MSDPFAAVESLVPSNCATMETHSPTKPSSAISGRSRRRTTGAPVSRIKSASVAVPMTRRSSTSESGGT